MMMKKLYGTHKNILNDTSDIQQKRPMFGASACLMGKPVRYDAGHK